MPHLFCLCQTDVLFWLCLLNEPPEPFLLSHVCFVWVQSEQASNHPRCLTSYFLREGQTSYIFTTNEARKITDSISCLSKNLIYLIECKKCHLQYIGETKRQLNERFGEHRRSTLNHQQLSTTTPVSLHSNQASHSINDVRIIPIDSKPFVKWRSRSRWRRVLRRGQRKVKNEFIFYQTS